MVVFLLNYGRKGVGCVAERLASQPDCVCAAIADELFFVPRRRCLARCCFLKRESVYPAENRRCAAGRVLWRRGIMAMSGCDALGVWGRGV